MRAVIRWFDLVLDISLASFEISNARSGQHTAGLVPLELLVESCDCANDATDACLPWTDVFASRPVDTISGKGQRKQRARLPSTLEASVLCANLKRAFEEKRAEVRI